MSEKTAFAAYTNFLALKQHFSSRGHYDYFKYSGKIKSNLNSFRRRKDRYYFEKLARKYSESELVLFFVSNLIINPDVWVGELCRDEKYQDVYVDWKKKKQALTYQFQCDMIAIKSNMENSQGEIVSEFNQLFLCRDNEYPRLFDLYNEGDITLETIIGVDMVLGCFLNWDRSLKGDMIWDSFYHLCRQYTPFLNFSVKQRNKFKEILRKEFYSDHN